MAGKAHRRNEMRGKRGRRENNSEAFAGATLQERQTKSQSCLIKILYKAALSIMATQ